MAETALSTTPVPILYMNYRGVTAVRRIVPGPLWFGSTKWHPEPQWLLTADEPDTGKRRDFALSGIKAFGIEAVQAAGWRFDMGAAPRDGTKVDLMFPRPRGRVVNAFWGRSHLAGADLWIWRTPTWGRGSIDPLPEERWDTHCYPNLQAYAWRLADEPAAPVSREATCG